MWDDEENLIAEGADQDSDNTENCRNKQDGEKVAKSVTFSEDQDVDIDDIEDKLSVTESQVSKVLSKRSQVVDEDEESDGPRRLKRNKINKNSDKQSNSSSVR